MSSLITCANCNSENESGLKFCTNCGMPLSIPSSPPAQPVAPAPTVRPSDALNQFILLHVKAGFRVTWYGDQFAQMIRPKQFNVTAAILFAVFGPFFGAILLLIPSGAWLGALIISLCFYFVGLLVLSYLGARDKTLFLYLGKDGAVHTILE